MINNELLFQTKKMMRKPLNLNELILISKMNKLTLKKEFIFDLNFMTSVY